MIGGREADDAWQARELGGVRRVTILRSGELPAR